MELTRNLMVESVQRLRPTPPRRIEVERTIADAIEVMRTQRVGCLLVTEEGLLVGVFTERDLLRRVLAVGKPLSDPLRDVITEDPVTVQLRDSISTAISRMQQGSYRHLPVVDETNHPIGILSAKRIVHYLVEYFPGTIYNQSPEPHRYPDRPEGA
jgi:CBS domain-containing protein